MPALVLATGPVTWGVDFADADDNPPWEVVLDDIARSDVDALELGPVGYLPEDPVVLRGALAARGLSAVGSFVFEPLHEPATRRQVLAVARRACRAIAAAEGEVLVIIDRPWAERVDTAGRSASAPRLGPRRWRQMIDTIERVAELARDSGLVPAIHPHAGGHIEFADEIERVRDDTDVGFCIDTGHCAYAGLDPAEVIRDLGDRIEHIHLKDVAAGVLDVVQRETVDFWTAVEAGIFCPLGRGVTDLPALLAALDAIGYVGHATIEQDRRPDQGTPLGDLQASIRVVTEAQQCCQRRGGSPCHPRP